MKQVAIQILFALLLGVAMPALGGEEVVLIASASGRIDELESPLVRRLFLGLTVSQHGARLRPLLNESDGRLREIFLQNIVSMSDSTYDRYLLNLALNQRGVQPKIFRSNAQVIESTAADVNAVTYAWRKDVEHDSRIRILRVLWHD